MSKELIEQLALRSGASVEQCVGKERDFRYGFHSTAQLEAMCKSYQAAAPRDNGMDADAISELIQKLSEKLVALRLRALIPDTQANEVAK
jgi:hypothetical protein